MSKLSCLCGHVIHDHTDTLPYKASFLLDLDHNLFFDWLMQETQSYVAAVRRGEVDSWLHERNYGADHTCLKLNHGEILHDHIHAQYCRIKRDAYSCTNCGRLYIQRADSPVFASYSSESECPEDLFGRNL